MANVEHYVQQIRSAVYGEQVRESIAKSIEEMNQDNIDTQAHYDNTITEVETATDNANTAATGAANIRDEVQQKLDRGDFIGEQGPKGDAASVRVGTVYTGQPGTAAQVNNSGTEYDAILNFIIPRGDTGEIENLGTATVPFPIDSVHRNIASGMTITQLFSRIQLLLNDILFSENALTPSVTPLTISSEWSSGYVNLLKIGSLTAVGITNLRRPTATSGYVDVATLPADIDISTKAYFVGFPFFNSGGAVMFGAIRITDGKVQFNTSNGIPDYGVYALIVYA